MSYFRKFTHDDFRAFLRETGYTIQDLHEKTGFSITTLYDYKKGTRPITDRASAMLCMIERVEALGQENESLGQENRRLKSKIERLKQGK